MGSLISQSGSIVGGAGNGITIADVQQLINAGRNTAIVVRPDSISVGATPLVADLTYGTPTDGDVVRYIYDDFSKDTFTYNGATWNLKQTPAPTAGSGIWTRGVVAPTGAPPAAVEFYLDTVTGKEYQANPAHTAWVEIVELDGSIWSAGPTAPAGVPPADKYYYLDTVTGFEYRANLAHTAWTQVVTPTAGIWLTGNVAPTGVPPADKYYYLDTVTEKEYKANPAHTAWVEVPADDSGAWLVGNVAPTGTPPADKEFYLDTVTGLEYKADPTHTSWVVAPVDNTGLWASGAVAPTGVPAADKYFYLDTVTGLEYKANLAHTAWVQIQPDNTGVWLTGAVPPTGVPPADKFFYLDTVTELQYKANPAHTAWVELPADDSGLWLTGNVPPTGVPPADKFYYLDVVTELEYKADPAHTAWVQIVAVDPSIWAYGSGPPVGAPPADKDFYRDRTNRTSWQKSADGLTWEQITDDLAGLVYDIPAPTPFSRSPQQADFQAALDADVGGPQTYVAGDELQIITATDGHYFSARISENAAAPGTLVLRPMKHAIPFGLEFTNLPGNRGTYHEGFPIVVNSIGYKMQSGAWARVTPPGGSVSASGGTGSGDVTTAQFNALALQVANKVDTAVYNPAIAAKVDQSIYDTKQAAQDAAIATKTDEFVWVVSGEARRAVMPGVYEGQFVWAIAEGTRVERVGAAWVAVTAAWTKYNQYVYEPTDIVLSSVETFLHTQIGVTGGLSIQDGEAVL